MSHADFYDGRYVVIGPPGTGKTTFLSAQARKVVERYSGAFSRQLFPNPIMICSLTRAAAAEVAGRELPVPKSAIGTLHAHCFRALGFPKIIGDADIEVWNQESSATFGSTEFGGKERAGDDFAFDRTDTPVETDGDKYLQEMEILRHKMVFRGDWDKKIADFANEWDDFKSQNSIVDFTDLIEMALATVEEAPGRPAVIMVDEAQDMSKLEYSLIRKWGEQASATIVVGDPWQALYTWRGADPSLFFDPSIPDTHRRVLSQSYRVPKNVLVVAMQWIKDHLSTYTPIAYHPRKSPIVDESDIAGEMGVRESTMNDTDNLVDETKRLLSEGRSVMFQAPCSYMLSGIISNLRRKYIPFSNPWRKYRRDWNPLQQSGRGQSIAKRMMAFCSNCPDMPAPVPWTNRHLGLFIDPMTVKNTLTHGAKKAVESMTERQPPDSDSDDGERQPPDSDSDTPSAKPYVDEDETGPWGKVRTMGEQATLSHSSDPMLDTISELFLPEHVDFVCDVYAGKVSAAAASEWWWHRLLATNKKTAEYAVGVIKALGVEAIIEPPQVFVGTVHSFKGAEASVTFIVPDLSKAGFRQWIQGKGEGRDEVVRLFYVAMTRAKERAFICRNATQACCPIRRYVETFYKVSSENGESR